MPLYDRYLRRLAVTAAVLLSAWLIRQAGFDFAAEKSAPRAPTPQIEILESGGAERIEQAFARRESGFQVTLDAIVAKTLRDDQKDARHQRFLIRLPNGRTLLVAHNIDLAERVAVSAGDPIRLRGQFEWNDRGGVLHWTHRAPQGDHPDGWIEVRGQRIE